MRKTSVRLGRMLRSKDSDRDSFGRSGSNSSRQPQSTRTYPSPLIYLQKLNYFRINVVTMLVECKEVKGWKGRLSTCAANKRNRYFLLSQLVTNC